VQTAAQFVHQQKPALPDSTLSADEAAQGVKELYECVGGREGAPL
jgi:hypothetical protein